MKDFAVNYEGNDIVAYNKLLFETFPITLFDPNYLVSNSLLNIGDAEILHGRGGIHSFEYNNVKLVLRHYHRGGIPANFIRDKYFWTNIGNSRAMQELQTLSILHKIGLPVPRPAAARIHKIGLTYQADIITVLIPNAKTLSSVLMDETITGENWQRIGETIKKFHNHDCNHADLNAHNIMLDEKEGIYLIDFDKSKINASSRGWQAKNLQRLKRSLDKLAGNNQEFNYTAVNFSSLMQGYAA